MSEKRVIEGALILGTPIKRARIVVDDADQTLFVGCTFSWCEFVISPGACRTGPLFLRCILDDTCTEVSGLELGSPGLAAECAVAACPASPPPRRPARRPEQRGLVADS